MSETTLKTKVIKYIKKHYPAAFIYKTCDRFTVGIPDIIICRNGLFIAIELKYKSGQPTKMQLKRIEQIRDAGGIAGVCWTLQQVKDLLHKTGGIDEN